MNAWIDRKEHFRQANYINVLSISPKIPMHRNTQIISFSTLIFIVVFLWSSAGISLAANHNIEHLNTFELMTLAGAAQAGQKTDEAGFLFLASQARYQIDKQVYPPVGKGGDSPGVLKAALGSALGKPIIEAVSGDADAARHRVDQHLRVSLEANSQRCLVELVVPAELR